MGNSNSNQMKHKMQNDDDTLATGISNMSIDDNENFIPGWIRDMTTQELRITIREVHMIDDYGEYYPGGYVLQRMENVTDQNRYQYEKDFYQYLLNVEEYNQMNVEGDPNKEELMRMTISQLKQICRNYGINNFSNKNKSELLSHIFYFFGYK
tara:strand:- start:321 stop:779 length:459 start_codon:yes stop_codon:yes gene_type:complete